ncbi:hypothetical protein HK100_011670 [Physocladia obscura]|uniref:Uncharacterized protein n=1 Tax=Physocladia obscura TaxID=109957 RepID=A0AAD5XK61_9FUNG|nr:hypothetical protein HK100_011670 [Physocladia obscura]
MEGIVTAVNRDDQVRGAIALAHSLRTYGGGRTRIVLVPAHQTLSNDSNDHDQSQTQNTYNLTTAALATLHRAFDRVEYAAPLSDSSSDSSGTAFLALSAADPVAMRGLQRVVFIAPAAIAVRALDPLFAALNNSSDNNGNNASAAFAAAPDSSWPDSFNTAVFAVRPSSALFTALHWHALYSRAFYDGTEQGLLNAFFRSWSGPSLHPPLPRTSTDPNAPSYPDYSPEVSRTARLPFAFNVTPTANYSYLPAMTHFENEMVIINFAGPEKPWNQSRFSDGTVWNRTMPPHIVNLHSMWWKVYEKAISFWKQEDEAHLKAAEQWKITSSTASEVIVPQSGADFYDHQEYQKWIHQSVELSSISEQEFIHTPSSENQYLQESPITPERQNVSVFDDLFYPDARKNRNIQPIPYYTESNPIQVTHIYDNWYKNDFKEINEGQNWKSNATATITSSSREISAWNTSNGDSGFHNQKSSELLPPPNSSPLQSDENQQNQQSTSNNQNGKKKRYARYTYVSKITTATARVPLDGSTSDTNFILKESDSVKQQQQQRQYRNKQEKQKSVHTAESHKIDTALQSFVDKVAKTVSKPIAVSQQQQQQQQRQQHHTELHRAVFGGTEEEGDEEYGEDAESRDESGAMTPTTPRDRQYSQDNDEYSSEDFGAMQSSRYQWDFEEATLPSMSKRGMRRSRLNSVASSGGSVVGGGGKGMVYVVVPKDADRFDDIFGGNSRGMARVDKDGVPVVLKSSFGKLGAIELVASNVAVNSM